MRRDAGDPAIRASALGKSYGLLRVLRKIDLEVARGECLGILGSNGAGKSTLLRLLSGIARASAGSLALFGSDCFPGRPEPRLLARIGLVSHDPLVYRDLTPRQNLEFFARLYRLDQGEQADRVAGRPTRALSRGMLQRLALARATLHEPELLLLDEPFTSLDASGRDRLAATLAELRDRGTTIALVTHDLAEIVALATRVVVLDAGRIASDLSPPPSLEELERLYRRSVDENSDVGHRS
jgi:ABC-type multidrug transport system ATPase subunit